MDTGDLWKLVALSICLVLSAFFSASETSFIALPRVRLMHLVSTGSPGARRVSKLIESPQKLLATVLLGNNLVNTAAAALATAVAISLLENHTILAVLAATIGVTILLLVFGETLPKTVAWSRSEVIAITLSRPIMVVGWVLFPAARLLQEGSVLAMRILRIPAAQSHVTEEEIRTLISVSAEVGTVEPSEAEMLEKVFHFGDRQVREIMTPRPEIVWLEKGATLEEFLDVCSKSAHTRFPVYQDDMENIIGILPVKDVVQALAKGGLGPEGIVTERLRPVYFVPETKLIGQLFSELRREGQQMAIVVDQFGGVAGLVTLKRLVEVIVGPVGEEGEPAREEFEAIGENVYDVDAAMAIQEANDGLGLDLPEGNYQTLAGFVLEQLGHIPHEGEYFYYGDLRLEVTRMARLKIDGLRIRRAAQAVEQREG